MNAKNVAECKQIDDVDNVDDDDLFVMMMMMMMMMTIYL
jgi:hypothetical protein